MIKRTIIKVLLAFMLVAFIGVVGVEWLWIRSGLREREDRFMTKVYDVLGQTVDHVDKMDKKRIQAEMARDIDVIRKELEQADTLLVDSISYLQENLRLPTVVERIYTEEGGIYMESFHTSGNSYLSTWITGSPSIRRRKEETHINRQLFEHLGDYLGIGGADRRSRLNRSEFMKVLTELIVNIADGMETIDEKVEKLLSRPRSDLDNFLKEKMGNKDIRIPFTWSVVDQKDIQQRSQEKGLKGFYYATLFPDSEPVKKYYLAIAFDSTESMDSLIYENMDWMFVAAAFCILGLMGIFIFTIVVITRQQKLSLIKNDFINNMTHEFKTPLATISLATSALMKEKVLSDPDQIQKFNTIIRSENDRMGKYVERILLQAKLDRREVHLTKAAVNLNDLVEEAVQHFRLHVDEAGGEMKEVLDPQGFVMEADEVHLFNVFCNLIDNAIKYSGGKIDIRVFTRREHDLFVVGVQDAGIGIPKEAQNKVFKRFYRVPSGNVHNVKGFGLGLSYVKSIVALHGGDIRLTSKKNKGTLIEILFRVEQ